MYTMDESTDKSFKISGSSVLKDAQPAADVVSELIQYRLTRYLPTILSRTVNIPMAWAISASGAFDIPEITNNDNEMLSRYDELAKNSINKSIYEKIHEYNLEQIKQLSADNIKLSLHDPAQPQLRTNPKGDLTNLSDYPGGRALLKEETIAGLADLASYKIPFGKTGMLWFLTGWQYASDKVADFPIKRWWNNLFPETKLPHPALKQPDCKLPLSLQSSSSIHLQEVKELSKVRYPDNAKVSKLDESQLARFKMSLTTVPKLQIPVLKYTSRADEILPLKNISDSKMQRNIVVDNLSKVTGVNREKAEEILNKLCNELPDADLQVINSNLEKLAHFDKLYEEAYKKSVDDKEKYERALEVQNLQTFLSFLGNIPELRSAVVVGQAALQVYLGVSALASLGAGASMGSILGPIGIIGGAVVGTVMYFTNKGNQQNVSAIMLQCLQQISEQISNLQRAIEENFRNVFLLQIKTLEAIQNGFFNVSLQLHYQLNGLRQDILYQLSKIEEHIKSIDENIYNQTFATMTQSLRAAMYESESVLNIDEARRVSRILLMWIERESLNDQLTGCYLLHSHSQHAKFIEVMGRPSPIFNELLFNNHLGYLMTCVDEINNKLRSEVRIPNLWLWYAALDKYLKLRQRLPQYFQDDDSSLNDLARMNMIFINYIDTLSKNECFWNKIFLRYYEIVETLQKHIAVFSKQFSEQERRKLNCEYNKKVININQNGEAIKLDILDLPHSFVSQFKIRSLHKNIDPINLNSKLMAILQRKDIKDLSQLPIHIALREVMNPEILAVEYLGGITFDACQLSENAIVPWPGTDQWQLSFNLGINREGFLKKAIPLHIRGKRVHVQNELMEEIVDQWQSCLNIHLESTIESKQSFTELAQDSQKFIDAYFIRQRKLLVAKLLGLDNSEGIDRSAIENCLLELDYCVRLIQSLIYLIGKHHNNELVNLLLTSNEIRTQLKAYYDSNSLLPSDSILPNLDRILQTPSDARLNYQYIVGLSTITSNLSSTHPLNLLTFAHADIMAMINLQKLVNLSLVLTRHVDLLKYQQHSMQEQQDVFQLEVYEELERLNEKPFNSAYAQLVEGKHLQSFGSVGLPKVYQEAYKFILYWVTVDWKRPSSEEDTDSQDIWKLNSESPLSIATLLENQHNIVFFKQKLRRGWERNVRLLAKIFTTFIPIVELSNQIPYAAMWRDGVRGLLKVINNPKYDAAAKEVGNDVTQRLADLKECYVIGKRMQSLIFIIGLSKSFIEMLLNGHEELFINLKQVIEPHRNLNDDILIRVLFESEHDYLQNIQGQLQSIMDKILASMLLIDSYIQMIFGYHLQRDIRLQSFYRLLLDQANIREFLKGKYDTAGNQSVCSRLQRYIELLKLFKDEVLYYIERARNIVAFKEYLENYYHEHQDIRTLILNGRDQLLFKTGISVEALNLIEQFLEIYRAKISVLEINTIDLNEEYIKILIKLLQKYSEIRVIGFNNTRLTTELFLQLSVIYPSLIKLQLSGNDFSNIGEPGRFSGPFFRYSIFLDELDLSNCQLGSKSFILISNELQFLTNLRKINLSGNPNLINDGNLLHQFINNFPPYLAVLLLANTGIDSKILYELLNQGHEAISHKLSKLLELDVSDNRIMLATDREKEAVWGFFRLVPMLTSLLIVNTFQDVSSFNSFLSFISFNLYKLQRMYVDRDFFEKGNIRRLEELRAKEHKINFENMDKSSIDYHKNIANSSTRMVNTLSTDEIGNPKSTDPKKSNNSLDYHHVAITKKLNINLAIGQPWLDKLLMEIAHTIHLLQMTQCVVPQQEDGKNKASTSYKAASKEGLTFFSAIKTDIADLDAELLLTTEYKCK